MTYLLWLESLVEINMESNSWINTYTSNFITCIEAQLNPVLVDSVMQDQFDYVEYSRLDS